MKHCIIALLILLLASCGGTKSSTGRPCSGPGSCPDGQECVDGRCVPVDGEADAEDGTDVPFDPADAPVDVVEDVECEDGGTPCGSGCCGPDETCVDGECGLTTGCVDNDGCSDDSCCREGACIPFGSVACGDYDDDCERGVSVDPFNPVLQCEYTDPESGDPAPSHVQVMATPMVADLNLDDDPTTLRPSIVFSTFAGSNYASDGVLRIIDGQTCTPQQTLAGTGDRTVAAASVALGNLMGDSRPEIIAPASGGGLVAFIHDSTTGLYRQLWRSGWCDGSGGRTSDTYGASRWAGAAIHDMDGTSPPEIVFGAVIYDVNGCILSDTFGYPVYSVGVVPVVADVDLDGNMELVQGNAIYEWDATAGDLVAETYFTGTGLSHGQVAVADFGDFPLTGLTVTPAPEIAVVYSGNVRVQTIEGTIVFGPYPQPGAGRGGPPTAGDFDGDGRVEFAAAGLSTYTVYDLDCVPGGDPAGCASGRTDGILWSQASQDGSSNVTGSSIFDFEGDGPAEAIYADECFMRVYRGLTGEVIFSQARSSGTTYENPIVADVDGDFNSELITCTNDYHSIVCPSTDPLFPSASHSRSHGIQVYADASDLWVGSRPIWNQHPYAVTHVGDRGEIPSASGVSANWTDPDLNNFRQQVQGDLEALDAPDLTSGGGHYVSDCDPSAPAIDLTTNVCNRGVSPIGAGMTVEFFLDDAPEDGGTLVCAGATTVALAAGECELVPCTWDPALADGDHLIYVVVDRENVELECYEENNWSTFTARCESIG
ncbi:MAG: hypothetical protein JRG91_03565 [Deltaproteobacteria bacterium]|nr:hypothetical protein [Deltaproteobacteria bacterium]